MSTHELLINQFFLEKFIQFLGKKGLKHTAKNQSKTKTNKQAQYRHVSLFQER